MSYIESSSPGFSKAVISFWFKVPQEALDAAQAEADAFYEADSPGDPPPFLGLVPLVVFGKEGTSRASDDGGGNTETHKNSTTVTTCIEHAVDSLDGNPAIPGTTYTMTYWPECSTYTNEHDYFSTTFSNSAKPGKPIAPSYIAIGVNGNLRINFESTKTGDVVLADVLTKFTDKYYTQEKVKECWTFQGLPGCGNYEDTVVSLGLFAGVLQILFAELGFRLSTAVADNYIDEGSDPRVQHPSKREYGSGSGDMGTGALYFDLPKQLAADRWHHVLISVDMTGGSASTGYAAGDQPSWEDTISRITATSLLYVAVDDKDYKTGINLFPGTNKVVTGGAAGIAVSGQAVDVDDDGKRTPQGAVPSYSLTDMSVPAGNIGMPAYSKYVDHIHHCEMAEFQLWTGKVLDTSNVSNRRAFIDYKKDADGNPIPDNDGKARLKPVKPDVAEKMLGKPVVNMHGSSKWIKGTNLGSGSAFTPTGKIKKYKPDPALLPAAGG